MKNLVFDLRNNPGGLLNVAVEVVKLFVAENYNMQVSVINKQVQDYRNYKVSTEKAQQLLNYKPQQDAYSIMLDLYDTVDKYSSFDDERFYNILVFKKIMMNQLITN